MPLSMGMRDEQNERINTLLKKLISLVFIPEDWITPDTDAVLLQLGLSYDSLGEMSIDELNRHLVKMNFDWANMEQFADILATHGAFKDKATGLYHYIQAESKMFSLDIFNKIAALNK